MLNVQVALMCPAKGNRRIAIGLSFGSQQLRGPGNIHLVMIRKCSSVYITNFLARLQVCSEVAIIKIYHYIIRCSYSKIVYGLCSRKRYRFQFVEDIYFFVFIVPICIGDRVGG